MVILRADKQPTWHTYVELARDIYGIAEPSATQLSAVRRSVGRLVASGLVERGGRADGWPPPWERPKHTRRYASGQVNHWCTNPVGNVVRRMPTKWEAAIERARERKHMASVMADFRSKGITR
jgi:hypothetical protein